jgi:ABC-type Fe3+-siderophore transport system permease subunit
MNTREPHLLIQLGVALFVVAAIFFLGIGSAAAGLLVADFAFMMILFVTLWLIVRARMEAGYTLMRQERQLAPVHVERRR